MPTRRTIGISFACLVTSACAIAEKPEESTTQSIGVTSGNAQNPSKSQSFACAEEERQSVEYGSERLDESLAPLANACVDAADLCCGLMHMAGHREFGRATWYGGRIIDLSPRAADVLEMKRAGVVAVVVDPLVY